MNVNANGAEGDKKDNDPDTAGDQPLITGAASLTLTANGIETVVVNSDVEVNAKSDALASQYSNTVTLNSDAVKTLNINGDGKVAVTTAAATLTKVDATGNSRGCNGDRLFHYGKSRLRRRLRGR